MKNLLVYTTLFIALYHPATAQFSRDSTKLIAPGLTYHFYSSTDPVRRIYVAEVDLRLESLGLEVVKASGVIDSTAQTVSQMFSEKDNKNGKDVLLGINADFFTSNLPFKNPRNMLISNGEILWDTIKPMSVFAVTDGNTPIIDTLLESYTVKTRSASFQFNQINRHRGSNELVLYNRFTGSSTHTAEGGTEIKIAPLGGENDWLANGAVKCKVLAADTLRGDMSFQPGEAVLSGHGAAKAFLDRYVKVGDTITLDLWVIPRKVRSVKQLSGGMPRIVLNGANYAEEGLVKEGNARGKERHPRTAVGYTRDKEKLYLVIVDGRSERSAGMTFSELADFMIFLGCYQALNLDGGGSSTFVLDGVLKNSPSDGPERPVGSAILVYRKSSPAKSGASK